MKGIIRRLARYADRIRCRDGHDYAALLKARSHFHRQGERCYIDFSVTVDEPYLVSLGDNVWLTDDVKILTHDGALTMLARAGGENLRKFGRVRLGDNVFVGMAACIMPGVSIGSRSVVATGSVVTRDVPDGVIVGGNPARVIGDVDAYLAKWRGRQEPFAYIGAADKRAVLVRNLMEDATCRVS